MNINAAEFDRLKCRLIAWLLHAQPLNDVEAAEQFLRTQIHPKLYESAQQLQTIMQEEGARFVRRVAERVGTDDIGRLFPDALPYLRAYQRGEGDAHLLSQIFRELAVLAAIVDRPFLEQLSTAVTLQGVVHNVMRKFQQQNGRAIGADAFWETYTLLKRAEGPQPKEHRAQESHPIVVRLKDADPYLVNAHVRMVDPVHRQHHVELQDPIMLRQFTVDRTLTVPQDRVQQHGLSLDIAFEEAYGIFTHPVRCTITPKDLEQIHARGSAIAAFIGREGDIRLFNEDIDVFPGESHPIPSTHVASIRVTPASVEITRLDRSVRLTVFA
jgi:hypothetical protein